MSAAESLIAALRASDRRRIPLDGIWTLFYEQNPRLRGHPTARRELWSILGTLVESRALRLPRGGSLYDRVQEPPLPRWVELPPPLDAERAIDRASRTAWHPNLEFVRTLPRLADEELEALLAIQRWLPKATDHEPLLTVRERSLRIFGDDKRLERLSEGRLFSNERLTFQMLRCRQVHVPFVLRDFGTGNAALVIENKDTYYSACEARACVESSSVRWIIFGSGKALFKSIYSLLDWPQPPKRLLYFGDLDRAGLEIATGVASIVATLDSLPPLACAESLYRIVIDRASAEAIAPLTSSPHKELEWLAPNLRTAVSSLLAANGRWPQEWVTAPDFVEWLPDA
jgi:hypothetical protein